MPLQLGVQSVGTEVPGTTQPEDTLAFGTFLSRAMPSEQNEQLDTGDESNADQQENLAALLPFIVGSQILIPNDFAVNDLPETTAVPVTSPKHAALNNNLSPINQGAIPWPTDAEPVLATIETSKYDSARSANRAVAGSKDLIFDQRQTNNCQPLSNSNFILPGKYPQKVMDTKHVTRSAFAQPGGFYPAAEPNGTEQMNLNSEVQLVASGNIVTGRHQDLMDKKLSSNLPLSSYAEEDGLTASVNNLRLTATDFESIPSVMNDISDAPDSTLELQADTVNGEFVREVTFFPSMTDRPTEEPVAVDSGRPAIESNVEKNNNVINQIVQHARLITRPHNTTMVIKLVPEHLGELTLQVVFSEGEGINAVFHTNNAETRSLLEASLPQLKQELLNQGLRVDYVAVYAGMNGFASHGQRQQQEQFTAKTSLRRIAALKQEDNLETSYDLTRQIRSGGGVDYRI